MYVVMVEFVVRDGFVDAFRDRVRQQARDSLEREADCHVFDVCIDPQRDHVVLLYEVYSDTAAFDAHLASAHFSDFDAAVGDWIESKRVTRFERIEADQEPGRD